MNRRSFLDFLGRGVVFSPLAPSLLSSCTSSGEYLTEALEGLQAQRTDELALIEGLEMKVLIGYKDAISASEEFGYDNDGIFYLADEGLLWVNHAAVNPRLNPNFDPDKARLRSDIVQEMLDVGGSLLKVGQQWGTWSMETEAASNRRLTGSQLIPFEWHEQVAGSESSFGTVANGSVSRTPWGTLLICEEQYATFYGDKDFSTGDYKGSPLQWELFFPNNKTEHYGWIVEFDPTTGSAKKHVALGRFSHGCVATQVLDDGRVVIYSGDEQRGGCLYKFISSVPGSIADGVLHVANFSTGRWEPIAYNRPELQDAFQTVTEMMIRTREAALLVGGTPLDRPQDIAIDAVDGSLILSLVNNESEENYFGSLMRITESTGSESLEFNYETYLTGGQETGFACPNHLAFDSAGSLWFTSDMPRDTGAYEPFGNNALYVVPREGVNAGKVVRMASAPRDAKFAGPCFAPDGTLFLSVQHPGSASEGPKALTSNWPDGPGSLPRPSVIVIQGEMII
ncbi:MAG: alkaline phosphatase PhoX [Bacteroidota bacterium]